MRETEITVSKPSINDISDFPDANVSIQIGTHQMILNTVELDNLMLGILKHINSNIDEPKNIFSQFKNVLINFLTKKIEEEKSKIYKN